jgi:hypothetical protein
MINPAAGIIRIRKKMVLCIDQQSVKKEAGRPFKISVE